MFGRKDRPATFQRQADQQLEDLRDDCIALFLNSGMTQAQLHEAGGPTPQTTSKWLYKETRFPRYDTIRAFLSAVDCELVAMPAQQATQLRRSTPIDRRLGLSVEILGKPTMPARGHRAKRAERAKKRASK